MNEERLPSSPAPLSDDVASIGAYRDTIEDILNYSSSIKTEQSIEPPLASVELGEKIRAIYDGESIPAKESKQAHYAAIETAFRDKFYDLIASISIEDPTFTQVWNLLDILSIFSDNEQCEPGLIFWLIEELLDSQTITGCRKIFDYLESRRERITAKHFKQKNLIILRSCNELLRRLSRAEDTVFCGRVFIFLFQSFPLGDKSSVNLRGEYHTENVTTFDKPAPNSKENNAMEIDASSESVEDKNNEHGQETEAKEAAPAERPASTSQEKGLAPSVDVSRSKADSEQPELDFDVLYPTFWSLQENFSSPTRLFVLENFESFKKGLESTIRTFRQLSVPLETRGTKRKQVGDEESVGNGFNPKYLTSRDLFQLEINDIEFRRHVLVQALIVLEFLLSLTAKSKAKLADMTNKSVLYAYTLKDEDAKWVVQIRSAIANYLQLGAEGKYYYRMVDTVLSRDRNWVRWKAQNCPPIEESPVSAEQMRESQDSAERTYTNKRMRAAPINSLNLRFLSQEKSTTRLDRLKNSDRSEKPTTGSLIRSIEGDDLDLEMAADDSERESLTASKMAKNWRVLRIASKNKLNLFDKVDDGKNLKVLSGEPAEAKQDELGENGDTAEKTPEVKEKENVEVPKEPEILSGGANHETTETPVQSIDAAVT